MRNPEDFLVVVFIVWLICGVVAAAVGPSRYSGRLFFLTFLFMGPLGIAAALITQAIADYAPSPLEAPAPVKRKIAEGRQRFQCPRCGAENDIPNADTSYECWRCGEHRKVKPKLTAKAT